MGNRKVLEIADIKDKVLGLNQLFLDSNFEIKEGNYIRFGVVLGAAQGVEYTLDDGVEYQTVNVSDSLVVRGSYLFRFPCSTGDKFNARITGGTALTLKAFKCELWLEA